MQTFFKTIQNDWANNVEGAPYNPQEVVTLMDLGYGRKGGKTLIELETIGKTLPDGWEWHNPEEEVKPTSAYSIEFYVAVNHSRKKLCIIIPGTDNINDVFKDYLLLTSRHIEPSIARKIIRKLVLTQAALLSEEGTYYTTEILGHSLGGSIAELTTMMINAARCEEKLTHSLGMNIPSKKRKHIKNLLGRIDDASYKENSIQYLNSCTENSALSALCFDPAGLPEEMCKNLEKEISFYDNNNESTVKPIRRYRRWMTSNTPDHTNILNVKTMPNIVSALNGSPGRTKIKVCPVIFDLIKWHIDRIENGEESIEQAVKQQAKTSAEQLRKTFLMLHKMVTYGPTTRELLDTLHLYPTDDQEKQNQVNAVLRECPPNHFYQISDHDWIEWSEHYSECHKTLRKSLNTATNTSVLYNAGKTVAEIGYSAVKTNPMLAAGIIGAVGAATYFGGNIAIQALTQTAQEVLLNEVLVAGSLTMKHGLFQHSLNNTLQTSIPCCRKKARD